MCDGSDNNCDGVVDEDEAVDATTWYDDDDGDGYGDPADSLVQCDQPDGYITDGSDCDDTDAAVNPAAVEVCNHVDDDCNGSVDDGLPMYDWYPDWDGDGYGDASATPEEDCQIVPDHVLNDADCDDSDAAINPNATEVCDGVDNDCDGAADEDDAADAVFWYGDADGDLYGDITSIHMACDAPDNYVDNYDDCDDNNADTYPGAPEYCNGADNDCDGTVDNDAVDGDWYYTDFDGDGYGAEDSLEWACDGATNELDCDDYDANEPVTADAVNGNANGAGTIDDPLDTAQGAIDAAFSCAVILAGTYYETIDFGGKDLKVIGPDGPENTIIDAVGLDDAVATFEGGESSDALLQGVTLANGTGHLEEDEYTWACHSEHDCTEYYSTYCGGGAFIDGGSPTLSDVIVRNNSLPEVDSYDDGYDTYFTYSYGGGLCFLGSDSVVGSVEIYENYADQGGGFYVDETSTVEIGQAWLIANTASDGGGGEVEGGYLTLVNLASTWNGADGDGGGILIVDGTLDETNVTHGEDDAPSGGGLYLSGSSTGTVMNSIIWGCDSGVGVLVDGGSSFTGSYNDVYGNGGGNYSGITDPTGVDGNISEDPLFVDVTGDGDDFNDDWNLIGGSPAEDAGNPDPAYDDVDGTQNDMGAFGGPDSDWDV